jgi:hypothetical protein
MSCWPTATWRWAARPESDVSQHPRTGRPFSSTDAEKGRLADAKNGRAVVVAYMVHGARKSSGRRSWSAAVLFQTHLNTLEKSVAVLETASRVLARDAICRTRRAPTFASDTGLVRFRAVLRELGTGGLP